MDHNNLSSLLHRFLAVDTTQAALALIGEAPDELLSDAALTTRLGWTSDTSSS